MLNRVAERKMHTVRWILTLGWFVLIASMFYDPITPSLTHPTAWGSPFRLDPNVYLDPQLCVRIRETCLPEQPFSLSVLMWWAMIVPAGILIIFVLGHEFWRRICPLSFLSQIPRALGIQRRRKVIDPFTQAVRSEVVTIDENSWLGRNHLYLQFTLFVLGLGLRILFVNGDRIALVCFLLLTIACAILVGYLYAGKSWCNYFCPMSPVQMIYTGPQSLLGSQAHTEPGITQSMCRSVDLPTRMEQSACVACKKPCIDIDAEKAYWLELGKPGRRLVHYGYLGMVIAFYFYYFLYSGNWDYYFTGAWTHEEDLLTKVFDPGFYIHGYAIPIPKAIAVYLTYGVFIVLTYTLGLVLEKLYRRYTAWLGRSATPEKVQHVVFTVFTLASFWSFFSYGARPSLNRLPLYPLLAFNGLVVFVGAMWFYRTIKRTRFQYERESITTSLRKQLDKLPIPPMILQGRSPQELSTDEVYTLVNLIPQFSATDRLAAYTGTLQDLLERKVTTPAQSLDFCLKLRQALGLGEEAHFDAIQAIAEQQPELLTPLPASSVSSDATTVLFNHRQSISKP